MVEKRAVLVERKLVDETLARHDRLLLNARNAIHLDRKFEAMPMDSGWLGQVIVEDDAQPVSLVGLDRRPRRATVEPPEIERSAWNDDLLHGLGHQAEDLDSAVYSERQISDVEGCYWNRNPAVRCWRAIGAVPHIHLAGPLR